MASQQQVMLIGNASPWQQALLRTLEWDPSLLMILWQQACLPWVTATQVYMARWSYHAWPMLHSPMPTSLNTGTTHWYLHNIACTPTLTRTAGWRMAVDSATSDADMDIKLQVTKT
jgi:hypothetical protein